jgi:predicted metalloprotease with PDZ domain
MRTGLLPFLNTLRFATLLAVATVMCACGVAGSAQQHPAPVMPSIDYTVSMSKPHTHLLEVEIRVRRDSGTTEADTDLVMPVWTPGSYMVREFARHVQDFRAADDAGRELSWNKIDKNTWRVSTRGLRDWRATYRVYANELSVRTNELNSSHGFWNNAALLMYPNGFLAAPSTLRVVAPEPWKVATALPSIRGRKNTFRADNFDVLYDSPVEVGDFSTLSFEVKGVPHRIVIDGEGNYDPEKMRTDVKKIVETQIDLMGGEVPYPDYTFFLHLRTNAGGGLEHRNSTALGYPRFGFGGGRNEGGDAAVPAAPQQRTYRGFLSLVSHEFFHVWNVKRIRPDALGPFDYTKENYTKLLWVAEGITSYYTRLTLRRAGLISDQDFLRDTASAIENLQKTPGRLVQSVEESSFDAWIKYYRQDENSVNSQISYYDKGALVGLLLDLEIRKRSNKSLDDVMRYLYTEFYKKNRNYTPEDFQEASELMAGASLEQFFSRYVRGREELDYNGAFAAAGLRLDQTGANKDPKALPEKAYLGADVAQEQDRLMVKRVYAGSPAYEQGLNTGDQILALNNMRATKDFLDARMAEKRPGDLITLTVFRFDDLSTIPIKLGRSPHGPYRIVAIDKPTSEQQRIYQSWLKAPVPK